MRDNPYHRAMRLGVAVVLLLTLMAFNPPPTTAQTSGWQQAVDEAIRDAVAASEIPGGMLVVGQGDQILHRKVLGWRATSPSRS